MKKRLGYILIIVGVPAFVLISPWFYRNISSHIPRSLKVQSKTLEIRGIYYPLYVDGIELFEVRAGKIVIRGYKMQLFWKTTSHTVEIIRTLPPKYARLTARKNEWIISESGYRNKTFFNTNTGETFSVELPTGMSEVTFSSYLLDDRTEVMIVAAGDWKVGPGSYYALITVKRRSV